MFPEGILASSPVVRAAHDMAPIGQTTGAGTGLTPRPPACSTAPTEDELLRQAGQLLPAPCVDKDV